ncbi:hypothetical protein F5Y16DRAFT_372992 [Xylariaceae sp. FL0255]|nr:hypothetical protein F5Y16DRAFT_372992 [Xylariaceae sp. FL0255]
MGYLSFRKKQARQGGLPLSPWNERFHSVADESIGLRPIWITRRDFKFDRSALAPEFPRLHPKFYCDVPSELAQNPPRAQPPRDGVEWDRLFTTERGHQKSYFHGLKTWEVAALNRWMKFSTATGEISGGHNSADNQTDLLNLFKAEMFQVDENGWFDFLKKDRWYDIVDDPNNPSPNPFPSFPQSVDQPQVWAELRVVLELANRMLRALVSDRNTFLETVLFGRIAYWKDVETNPQTPLDDALVLLSPAGEQRLATKNNSKPWKNQIEALSTEAEKIKEVGMALENEGTHQAWSFHVDEDPGGLLGLTRSTRNEMNFTSLNTEFIRQLVIGGLTLTERCMLYYHMAVTIMHEYMHSIMARRVYCFLGRDRTQPEPFFDFDSASEIGEAMELRVLGGRNTFGPFAHDPPIMWWESDWPNWYTAKVYPGIDTRLNHATQITQVYRPPMDAGILLSAEFWNDSKIAKKSENLFHRTVLFHSQPRRWNGAPMFGLPPFWPDVEVDRSRESTWESHHRKIVARWEELQTLWKSARKDWYPDHLKRWWSSPWCMFYTVRRSIENFKAPFDSGQEYKCWEYLCKMSVAGSTRIGFTDWTGKTAFLDSLPTNKTPTNYWIVFSIGMLMSAAMAIRTTDVSLTIKKSFICVYKPGSLALAKIKAGWKMNLEYRFLEPEVVSTREPSEMYNPFGTPDAAGSYQVTSFTQLDYLNLVDNILTELKDRRAIVSGPWFREIQRVSREMRTERETIQKAHPDDHLTWEAKKWEFRIPDYDPDDLDWMIWDPAKKAFDHYKDYDPSWDRVIVPAY